MLLAQFIVLLFSLWLLFVMIRSVVRTLVLPRPAPDLVTGILFLSLRHVFEWRLHWARTYQERDAVMAYYSPVALLLMAPTWLVLTCVAFAGLFWATGPMDWYAAFTLSGSSLFTLGFQMDNTGPHMLLAFVEAGLGMMIIALLIGYLPTMYSAFSAREAAVNQLDVRAGTPPSVQAFVTRAHRIGKLTELSAFWREWEILFTQIAESHTTLPALVFFRSPRADHSWITAAGSVLDTAAFVRSTVDVPHDPQANLRIRAGFLCLRSIADYFAIEYPLEPRYPANPISITQAEYDAVYDELLAIGAPLHADREQAWRDFAGWRVNYDAALIQLCALLMPPPAPWSSDRAPKWHLRAIVRRSKA